MKKFKNVVTYKHIINFLEECKIHYADAKRSLITKNSSATDVAVFDNELINYKGTHKIVATVDKLVVTPLSESDPDVVLNNCELVYIRDWQLYMLKYVGEDYYNLLDKFSFDLTRDLHIKCRNDNAIDITNINKSEKELLDDYIMARQSLAHYDDIIRKQNEPGNE